MSLRIFATIGTIAVFLSGIFLLLSWIEAEDKLMDTEFRLKWNSGQPGYLWHVLSTVFEWVLINTVSPVFVCIALRMRQFPEWHLVNFSK